jgi:hypothetical protein
MTVVDYQYPSNARPTQLIANIEQASAAAEARVAIAFAERAITLISLEQWTDNIVAGRSRLWPKGHPEKNVELSRIWHTASEAPAKIRNLA